jgi:hypothetical protein
MKTERLAAPCQYKRLYFFVPLANQGLRSQNSTFECFSLKFVLFEKLLLYLSVVWTHVNSDNSNLKWLWKILISKPFNLEEEFQAQTSLLMKNSTLKTILQWRISSSNCFTPEEFQAQNLLTLKNSKLKTLYPWRIPSSKPFTLEEFQAQNPLSLTNSKLKTLYLWRIPSSKPFTTADSKLKTLYPWLIPSSEPYIPDEFQAQNPLPLKNSKFSSSEPFTPDESQAQNPLPLKNSRVRILNE